ncbi:MAG: ABC transporter permease, partial [Clostridia bacterium]|nr:ABC transporter permease [Clostridia bacterium]
MLKIILKKVAEVTVVMLLISIFSFAIIEMAPGDISSMYISADMSPEEQEMVMEKLGLNKSGTERYIEWLKEAVKGNWGYSISYKLPVADMLVKRLPSTLLLMGTSLIVSLAMSIPLGLIAGYKKNTWVDNAISGFAYFGMSIPS